MFQSKTRTVLKALAFTALVQLASMSAQAVAASPAKDSMPFVFQFSVTELADAQSQKTLRARLRDDVRRYCHADVVRGASVIAEPSCRRIVYRAAHHKLIQKTAAAGGTTFAG